MKITLVVASGANEGREIVVPGTQFIIGRDEGCHLRPASPAISKKHCAIFVREGKVYVRDLGSTNGTHLNDQQVDGDCAVNPDDRLKVGPLDFVVKITGLSRTDTTAAPDGQTAVSPALKALTSTPAVGQRPVPAEAKKSGSATIPVSATKKDTPAAPKAPVSADDPDHIAAMLLGMGDEEDGVDPLVPEGSTIMQMPALDAQGNPIPPKPEDKNKIPSQADSSSAARDLLSRYTKRPR